MSVLRRVAGGWAPALLLALGAVLRLAWLLHQPLASRYSVGEALNVARSIAQDGAIASAFRPDGAPTAHLMPISPGIAGGVYRLLGFQTVAAESVLTAWSMLLVGLSFWLLYLTFGKLGTPRWARLAGLAALCLLPLNFALEAAWFRVWEGALAVALMSAYLYLLVSWDRTVIGWGKIAAASLLFALLAFVQPNFGVAGGLATLIFVVRTIPPRRWPATVAIASTALVLVFAPWVARNISEMGTPILLRSNVGLEMALAFNDEAASRKNPRAVYFERHFAIHPYAQGPGYAALRAAGGEVAYANQLRDRTSAWIAAHPGDTARLMVRHIVETLFPPAWYWTQFSDRSSGTGAKLVANWLISGLGLAGIVLMLASGDGRRFYAPIFALVTLLPFALVQPTLRYRYLVLALLVYLGTVAVARVAVWLGQRLDRPRGITNEAL